MLANGSRFANGVYAYRQSVFHKEWWRTVDARTYRSFVHKPHSLNLLLLSCVSCNSIDLQLCRIYKSHSENSYVLVYKSHSEKAYVLVYKSHSKKSAIVEVYKSHAIDLP